MDNPKQKAVLSDLDPDIHTWAAETMRLGSEAVRTVQEDARWAGVPNVYSINGILHWELPDGSLSTKDPWEGKDKQPL